MRLTDYLVVARVRIPAKRPRSEFRGPRSGIRLDRNLLRPREHPSAPARAFSIYVKPCRAHGRGMRRYDRFLAPCI